MGVVDPGKKTLHNLIKQQNGDDYDNINKTCWYVKDSKKQISVNTWLKKHEKTSIEEREDQKALLVWVLTKHLIK